MTRSDAHAEGPEVMLECDHEPRSQPPCRIGLRHRNTLHASAVLMPNKRPRPHKISSAISPGTNKDAVGKDTRRYETALGIADGFERKTNSVSESVYLQPSPESLRVEHSRHPFLPLKVVPPQTSAPLWPMRPRSVHRD
jgi:hypothetical protein